MRTEPAGRARSAQIVQRCGFIAVVAAVLLLGCIAPVLAVRYDVSYITAARGLVRQLALGGIEFLVRIYDPTTRKAARLGPDSVTATDFSQYERIEDVFRASRPPKFAAGRSMLVDRIHNERIVRSAYSFSYQTFDEPHLQELRTRYRLDATVRSAENEFDGIVRLREWARSQFSIRDVQPMSTDFDALEVLNGRARNIQSNGTDEETYAPCQFFSLLFAEAVLSVGHQARLVTASNHGVVEVWSNAHKKWVVMDPELDVHYELDGVPLNMLDLLVANHDGAGSRVQLIRGRHTSDPNAERLFLNGSAVSRDDLVAAYDTHIELTDLRNDWMTNHYFPGHPARSESNSLVYSDPRARTPLAFAQRIRSVTERPQDLYWTLNQSEILALSGSTGETIRLAFRTVTPNFDHFEIRVDDRSEHRLDAALFDWTLHDGLNALEVASVNSFGVRGIASSVAVVANASSN